MQKWLKLVLMSASFMLLASGCGDGTGGGGGGGSDTTKPVITLKGSATVALNVGDSYTDAGAEAIDDVDGDITDQIVTLSDVNTSRAGTYHVTYNVKDTAGNAADEVTRAVTVTAPPPPADTTAPVFTSSATASVPENQTDAITLAATDETSTVTYAISGTDAASFDLNTTSGVVTFKTAPDYETKNTYTFTATAADAAGNTATQNVTIHIIDVDESQPLKRTGQTKSYDEDGNEIDTSLARDDGHYQTGVDFNYTRDDTKQIVTDHITGLQWQDDANAGSVTKQWLTDDNYDKCANDGNDTACYDTSGDTAATYCNNLTLGGYTDWRLPAAKELDGIVDYGRQNPAIAPTFQHTVSDRYWSSSTYEGHPGGAWGVFFYSGYRYYYGKDYGRYVRCVRAGE